MDGGGASAGIAETSNCVQFRCLAQQLRGEAGGFLFCPRNGCFDSKRAGSGVVKVAPTTYLSLRVGDTPQRRVRLFLRAAGAQSVSSTRTLRRPVGRGAEVLHRPRQLDAEVLRGV